MGIPYWRSKGFPILFQATKHFKGCVEQCSTGCVFVVVGI